MVNKLYTIILWSNHIMIKHGMNKTSILFLWQMIQAEGSSRHRFHFELMKLLNRSIDRSSSELNFIILILILATFCKNSMGVIVPSLISSVPRLIRINRTYEWIDVKCELIELNTEFDRLLIDFVVHPLWSFLNQCSLFCAFFFLKSLSKYKKNKDDFLFFHPIHHYKLPSFYWKSIEYVL